VIQERRRLLREGLALWVAAQDDLELVGTAGTGSDLLTACDAGPVDFVMFEADVAEWDPIETAHELRRRHPSIRLVGTADDGTAARAFEAAHSQAGPCAVVPRRAGIEEILAAVRGGAAAVPVQVPAPLPDPLVVLTDRQLEVLVCVGMGLAAHEIAARLDISPKTVDNHKQRIYARLGVQSQAHAVAVAMRAGLIPGRDDPGGGFAS
jgi:DNA-binding NarL/FixJ family response regulator